jgi:hypothetical protein
MLSSGRASSVRQRVGAVVAGVFVIIGVTILLDIVLHATGVFPPMDQPINDALALLATAYRIVISVGGAWRRGSSVRSLPTGVALSSSRKRFFKSFTSCQPALARFLSAWALPSPTSSASSNVSASGP